MVTQSLFFALFTWGLTFVIALIVAGIIMLIYRVVHKKEPQVIEQK